MGKRVLIDFLDGDIGAQLLAAQLDESGAIHRLGPETVVRSDDELWFTSQNAFLQQAARFKASGCDINVVIRRARTAVSAKAFVTELAVLAAVVARMDNKKIRFHAFSSQAAEHANSIEALGCQAIGAAGASAVKPAIAQLNAEQGQFTLLKDGSESPLSLGAVNWARLARDYRITADNGTGDDWLDLIDFANRIPATPQQFAPRPLYVFVTPNGVGLGHLTRQIAVARALEALAPEGEKPAFLFWCFSRAAIIPRLAGYDVILRHTSEHLGAETAPWQAWETAAFVQLLKTRRPNAIITDGSQVEPFIVNALQEPGCHHSRLVWIRRGMWRSEADDRGLADVRFCDKVLVPGDLAAQADLGATSGENPNPSGLSEEITTSPVVLAANRGPLSRREARRALKLGRGKTCLVSLGGQAFSRTSILPDKLRDAAHRAKVRLVWAQSPLAASQGQDMAGDQVIARYPISPYIAAFDGVISAAGYNSFHELMLTCDLPVLFIPTSNERLDDQPARARFAAANGWASVLDHEEGDTEDDSLVRFFEALRKGQTSPRPDLVPTGATEMAKHVQGISTGGRRK